MDNQAQDVQRRGPHRDERRGGQRTGQEAPASFTTVGATEDEEANRDTAIAPGFTDMEPGAGAGQYGPSGPPGPLAAPQDPNVVTGPGFTAPEALGETTFGKDAGDEPNPKSDPNGNPVR